MKAKGNAVGESADKRDGQTGRWMGFVIAFLGILLGASTGLRAQGVRYDNIVLGPRGGPVASATVAVCAAGTTTSTTPCSPLATVYSDEALKQPMANPFQADSLGNYGFWAPPGHYVVQIYGTGVTTRTMNVFLPCDPSDCSMSNASFSSITAGTLNLTGSLTVNGRPVATEPKADDAVMYVSPNGNDSASGLSWGSAKQTLYGAISAMTHGGTLYVAANTACGGPVSGQGLWLYNSGNSSPGTGWLPLPGALTIIGVGTTTWAAASPVGQVALNCGSASEPALQIDGNNLPLKFENLDFTGSEGAYLNGATSIAFDGDSFAVNDSNATNGPAVLIGANSFELYFRHCVFYANDNSGVTRNGSDATEAFVINPGGNSDDADIYIDQSVTHYGSLVDHTYAGTWGLVVNGLLSENQEDGHGLVWFPVDTGTQISGYGNAYLNNVGVADATTNPTPAVEVDGDGASNVVTVVNATGYVKNIIGPATVFGGYANNWQNVTDTPPVEGEQGIIQNRLYAVNEIGASLFSPLATAYANEADQLPSQWVKNGGSTLTTGAAPDGTNNAGIIPSSSSYYMDPSYSGSGRTVAAGDIIVGGVWVRNQTSGTSGTNLDINIAGCSGQVNKPLIPTGDPYVGQGTLQTGTSGQWTWWPFAIEFTTGGTNCYIQEMAYSPAGQTMEFFAPYFHYFASGTVTPSEAARIALNLAPYPDSLNPPVEATLRGHPFAFGGSGDNYFATLDHTGLTANRTYDFPDASGTIALSGANGVSAGKITLSGGSGSHTFPTPYGTAPVCAASDTTSAAAVKVTSSTTAVSISGTGSDVVAWVCSPATN